jgi:two-component system LytT family response regulator
MSKLLKVIIIEDEAPARVLLRTYIQNLAPQLSIEAECENLPNGIKAIRKYKPDLVFLDIEMPGHSGLELLDFFSEDEVNFDIIFTTGYSEFAIKAFKLSAFDYLLKPIDEEELLGAIQRFIKKVSYGQQNIAQLKQELGSIGSGRIAVPIAGSIKFIELKKVLYFKADNSYTEIFFIDGSTLVVSRTLKNFELPLEGEKDFFRCHKSYIVNLAFVSEWIKSDGGQLLFENNLSIPVSSEKFSELTDRIRMINR